MKKPLHQQFFTWAIYGLIGYSLFGTILDATSNAQSLIPRSFSLPLSIIVLVLWGFAELFLIIHPIRWVIKDGNEVRLKHLGKKPRIAIIGVIALIWIPWLLKDHKDGQASLATIPDSPTVLTSERARLAINAMVKEFPKISPLRILSITSPVNGISAVSLDPPYREFPNVVIFHYDEGANRWRRAHEALCIGIQGEVSGIRDLHTIGCAVDLSAQDSTEQRNKFSDFSVGFGWVTITYPRFVHIHECGRETYYIDKSEFSTLATRLLGDSRALYPDDTCTLFDMPRLMDVSLSHDSGRFKLIAHTLNNQEWTVTFTGIDGAGNLYQKSILAENTQGEASRPNVR